MRTAAVDDWEGGAVVGRKAGRMGQRGDKFNARLIVQSGVEERGLMLTGPCECSGPVITPPRLGLVVALLVPARGVNTRFSSAAPSCVAARARWRSSTADGVAKKFLSARQYRALIFGPSHRPRSQG